MNRWVVFSFNLVLSATAILYPVAMGSAEDRGKVFKVETGTDPFMKGEKEKYRLKMVHPYSFDVTVLEKIMARMAFQRKQFSWSDKKRLFSDPVIKHLAPRLVEQYTRAGPDQRVTFKIINKKGKTVLEGDTFLTPEGLNWRIFRINRSVRSIDDFSVTGEFWRLVPIRGQTYKSITRFKDLNQDLTNWITMETVLPVSSRILPLPPAKENLHEHADREEGIEVKAKLRLLEEIKNEGLISETEYQRKRKQILEKF